MDTLEELYKQYNFPPDLIFNMDETMVDASGHRVKVIQRAGSPRPFTENEKKLEHITLALCINAAGHYLPPLCILPLKTLPPLKGEITQFFFLSGQENGFINNEIWHKWVEQILIPYIIQIRIDLGMPGQKALFIVDSHSTRAHQPTILLFETYNILVIILPAHSSTIMQPLDLAPNKEFKRNLRIHFPPKPNEERAEKRNRLLFTTMQCLAPALTPLQITQGFSRAGIWPFSKEAPLNSNLVRNPLAEINFQVPKKRTRGVRIAGKVLTFGESAPPALPALPAPLPSLPPPPAQPSTNSAPQQLYYHQQSIVPSVNSFLAL